MTTFCGPTNPQLTLYVMIFTCGCAGEKSGFSAKEMLDKTTKQLGGSGGGSDRIAQGKVKKIAMVKF